MQIRQHMCQMWGIPMHYTEPQIVQALQDKKKKIEETMQAYIHHKIDSTNL